MRGAPSVRNCLLAAQAVLGTWYLPLMRAAMVHVRLALIQVL